jgi:hypothetical protein
MKVYGQIEKAQLENTTSDTASHPAGMITYRTDTDIPKVSNGTAYKEIIVEDIAQALSNKIFNSPEINGATLYDEVATPSNPSANEHKVYFKSDGNMYSLDSTGSETPIGSGAGGGGSAVWRNDSGGTTEDFENGELVNLFEQGITQTLTLFVRVPSGYIAGRQIKSYLGAYSPSSSNDWKMQIVSTLVRAGTDAITSTTNQNTANSGDISNSVANQLRELTINLTDASGQVNSVAVSPGDLLKLELTRIAPVGTEDTADIRLLPNSTEIKFS